jgi:hypothetical protein
MNLLNLRYFLPFQIAKLADAGKPVGNKKPLKQRKGTEDICIDAESVDKDDLDLPDSRITSKCPESRRTRSQSQPKKKIYKGLNIQVSTLSEVQDDRAMAALAFKTKRLAKVHRENVNMNLIHEEKLRVAGKL